MTPLTIAVLGGAGAMLGWGLADLFAKISIDDVGELPSLAWGHLVGTVILGVATLARAGSATDIHYGRLSPNVFLGLAFFGSLQAVVYYLLYKGFGQGQVACLSPTFASFSGLVALGSILFFSESATVAKIVALATIFVGIMFLSSEPKTELGLQIFKTPGFRAVIAATGLATIWTLGWAHLVGGHDPIFYAFAMYAFMTLAIFLLAWHQGADLSSVPRRAVPALVVIGCGETAAYASLSWGYSRTSLTSVVALLSGAFSLPTIILASVFLRERLRPLQVLGATAVIGGVVVIAVT